MDIINESGEWIKVRKGRNSKHNKTASGHQEADFNQSRKDTKPVQTINATQLKGDHTDNQKHTSTMDTINNSGEWTKVHRSKNSKKNNRKTKQNKHVSNIPGEETTDMTSSDPEHYNNTSSDSDSDAPNEKQYHKHISLMCQEASPENTTYMGHPPEETPKDVIKTIPEDHAHANSTQKKGITNATNINNTFIDKGEDKGKTYQSQYNPIEELTHDSEECKTKQDMVAQNTIQPNIANKTEGMTKTDNVLYATKTINGNLQEHKVEQDITAENPIESNTATKTINGNLQEHKIEQDITAENPIESNTANTQNKTKRVVITGLNDPQRQISDLALQAQIFDEHYDIKTRCNVCRQCKRCSPLVAVRVKEKENIEKNEENIKIREFMKIVLTEEGKKKFVTRMPCEQSIIDEALEGSNRKDVIIANDKKLRQLTTIQQQELWEEFTRLSEESQQKLDTAVATYYIAVAPAFKSTLTSTKTRCAFDASMTNRSTKTSLNDILPVGFMGISLTATFRNFRLHPIG